MTTFRFIHCSDLHIDSPFKGLSRVKPLLAKRLRATTAQAWDNIVTCAVSENVDAVLVVGDIFDGADRSLQAQFKFRRGLQRLSDAGIPSFIVCGNHDPLDSWSQVLSLPEAVTVFPGNTVERRAVLKDGRAVAQIYGTSFPRRDVTDNLASRFQREAKDGFAIALLHANVGGDPNHDNYAPCSLDDLKAGGFDYWALGHIHLRSVLHPADPAVVYPGNTQARHFKETGAKGCCLVTLQDRQPPNIRFMTTDAARFQQGTVDLTEADSLDAVLERIESVVQSHLGEAEDRLLAMRLTLTGRTALRRQWQEQAGLDDLAQEVAARLGGSGLWLELNDATRGEYDLDTLRGGQDFIADLIALYDETEQQSGQVTDEALVQALGPVFKSWKGRGLVDPITPEEMKDLLQRARDLTLDHMLTEDR